MSQLPRYESYKDSGVQWLGEIPSHWAVKKLKFLTSYFKGFAFKSEDFSDIGIPLIKASNVKKFSIENVDSHIAFEKVQDAFDRVKLQEGDLILSTVGSLPNVLNSAVGQIAYVSPDFEGSYLNQNNVCFRSNEKVLPIFLKYFVMSSFFRRNLDVKALWIANQAYLEVLDVQNIYIIFPDLNEQKIIADFLDKRLAQVDALIAKQETLLAKLAEQRVALISHAVTKGLNPDVKLQKSDSEILGRYPETWKVKRLRFEIETNPSKSEIKLEESELVSFIPMEAVSVGGGLDLSNERMISEVSSGYTYFADGDVIVAKITPCFENGKASIAENLHQGMAFGTTELHVLRCKKDLLNKFLFFIIQSDKFMKYGESEMYGAGGQKRVPERFIKDYLIALPSLVEQKQICDFIESQLSHLDGLVQKVESTIATFKEYRSTLITQVVTGKIDVRNLKLN